MFKMNRTDRNYEVCYQLFTLVLFKDTHEN